MNPISLISLLSISFSFVRRAWATLCVLLADIALLSRYFNSRFPHFGIALFWCSEATEVRCKGMIIVTKEGAHRRVQSCSQGIGNGWTERLMAEQATFLSRVACLHSLKILSTKGNLRKRGLTLVWMMKKRFDIM